MKTDKELKHKILASKSSILDTISMAVAMAFVLAFLIGGLYFGFLIGFNAAQLEKTCEFEFTGVVDLNLESNYGFDEFTASNIKAKFPCGQVQNITQIINNFRGGLNG